MRSSEAGADAVQLAGGVQCFSGERIAGKVAIDNGVT